MPMDAVFLHGLTQELTQSLTGARIDKVQQPERDLLLLSVRTQGGNAKLLVHGGVGSARVHFTRGTFEKTGEIPPAAAQEKTMIRSRMPLKKAVKMGVKSMKTKPFRLAFTIFYPRFPFSCSG